MRVGDALGEGGIKMGGMHVGRASEGMPQLMILNVDQPVPEEQLARSGWFRAS